ncbi:MAG: hypothetical protein ABIG60_05150 [Patescibacteria group bacterium]
MRKKIIYLSAVLGILLLFQSANATAAVASPIQGGDSFEEAVELTEGIYECGELSEEAGQEDYYFIEVKPGQEVKITDNLEPILENSGTNNELFIYDENENEITSEMDGEAITFFWAVNSKQSSYKYYVKVEDIAWGTESYTLKVDITEHYDANSQTDAGDNFEKALSVEPGKYKGSLAYMWWQEQGLDTYDFYEVEASKEAPLTITLTPPSDGELGFAIYDSQQKLIKDKSADNAGEILTETFSVSKDDEIYIKVSCEYCYDDGIYDYDLKISSAPGETAAEVETTDTETADTASDVAVAKTATTGINWILIVVIIGLGFLLLIAVIIVIVVLVKKKNKKQT